MRESAGKRLEKLKENYVAKCNSIGQQTKIRVINKTPFSFKLSLKVAGVVYQEATLYASDASNNIELNSRTASSGNQNQKSSFSVTALPCGYVWYTVTAERFGNDIKEEERFLKMSCYKMGVFGGSSISIQETHPGSRKFKFEQEVQYIHRRFLSI
mmetsp:Transcript_7633/g.9696  ORF Transcript_7633/g.9696 Transcript_7633/m.9696 type:complete len:156 (-) Transcript_7633:773-1240(-)